MANKFYNQKSQMHLEAHREIFYPERNVKYCDARNLLVEIVLEDNARGYGALDAHQNHLAFFSFSLLIII